MSVNKNESAKMNGLFRGEAARRAKVKVRRQTALFGEQAGPPLELSKDDLVRAVRAVRSPRDLMDLVSIAEAQLAELRGAK